MLCTIQLYCLVRFNSRNQGQISVVSKMNSFKTFTLYHKNVSFKIFKYPKTFIIKLFSVHNYNEISLSAQKFTQEMLLIYTAGSSFKDYFVDIFNSPHQHQHQSNIYIHNLDSI